MGLCLLTYNIECGNIERTMRTIAVIPAFNEAKTIVDVVNKTLHYVDGVVVIDDSSTDDTYIEAVQAGAATFCALLPRGAGKAIREGVENALVRYHPDTIVLIDGDGQHDPSYIPQMLERLEFYDMVITSRFMDKQVLTKMPAYRRFGIWMITFAYNFGAKFKVKDSQCGLRAFRANVLKAMDLQEDGFGYSTEMLVKARAMGFKIIEIPTVVFYHEDFKQNSSMNPILHGFRVLLCTLKWRWLCEVVG